MVNKKSWIVRSKMFLTIAMFVMLTMASIIIIPVVPADSPADTSGPKQEDTDGSNKGLVQGQAWAQSFVPTRGKITRVQLFLSRTSGTFFDTITVEICKSLNPYYAVEGGDFVVQPPVNPPNKAWVEFDIDDVEVNIGQTYYLVVSSYTGYSDYFQWWSIEEDRYDDGILLWNPNGPHGHTWHNETNEDFCFRIYGTPVDNRKPLVPDSPIPLDSESGKIGISYNFSAETIDPDNNLVSYKFKWGEDGPESMWGDFQPSGKPYVESHDWDEPYNTYYIRVKARDPSFGTDTDWSWYTPFYVMRNGDTDTPVITGPKKVCPSMSQIPYTYTLNLSNSTDLQDFYVKIDIENENSRLDQIIIPNDNSPPLGNTNTSGWFKCNADIITMICHWPTYFLNNPGDYKITVITKQGSENPVYGETGELDINVDDSNWNPNDVIWTVSTNGPYNAQVDENINLACSVNNGTPPYTVIWDFGDNSNITTGQNTCHSYDKPGYYPIICTVEDSTGTRQETYTYASIIGVRLTTNSSVFLEDQPVKFTTALYDIEPSSNHWYVFSTGQQIQDSDADGIANITTSFSESGTHTINVTLHNGSINGPVIASDNLIIKIIPFEVDVGGPYTAINGAKISFKGVVNHDYQWISPVWDFGDGEYGYGLDTTHTYDTDENTTYNVTLTVNIWGVGNNTGSTTATMLNITNYTYPVADLDGPYCGNKNQGITMDGSGSTGDSLRYFWKIGKGVWEEGNSVINRVFSDVGDDYPVSVKIELKVVDQYNFSDTTSTYATISELKSDFCWSPSVPNDLTNVSFQDTSDPDGCNDPDYWYWDFGDNSTSTEQNPDHQYSDDGYYYVKLKVKAGTKQSIVTKRIYIDNVAPTADFDISPLVAPINDPVLFNCTSTDPDGDVVFWERNFGDGNYSYEKNTSYNYSESGFHSVTTYVMDDDFDQDHITKYSQLLIADAVVSNDFNETSQGWNVTRYNSLQSGIDAVTEGGVLVVLDGTYSASALKVNKSMDIYAIQSGYNSGDTEILYGGVVIQCEPNLPIFNITASNVKIKGFALTGGRGIRIEGDYITIQDCTLFEDSYGIICEDSSHIDILNTVLSGSEASSITIKDSNSVLVQDAEISDGVVGVLINNSVNNLITDCDISETSQGVQIVNGSNGNVIQKCDIYHVDDTAVLIDNSTGNVISECKIADGYMGVKVVDVCPDNQEPIYPGSMLNTIEDTNFTNVDYGVYLYNSSHTTIGRKSWSFSERDGELYLIYDNDETDEGPVVPFPSTLENATSIFAYNDYPIYIDHSHYNVVEGIAIAHSTSTFAIQNGTLSSCNDGISVYNSGNNVVVSCLIQDANHSAVNITNSEENTICLCMLKENHHGITASLGSHNNMFIGCSFFNNTEYGIEMKEETAENLVIYNDFVFNNQSILGSFSENHNQAHDDGDNNMWDDDGCSVWRDLVCGNYELSSENDKKMGNFWADYKEASFSENGTGPIPSNLGPTSLLRTGEEPYFVSGRAENQDGGPILESLWPESWYEGDYPWVDPGPEEPPYPLPPIP